MRTIGITGGVGSGKSRILDYLKDHYNCIILKADIIANQLKEPGTNCYEQLITLLGIKVLGVKKEIDSDKMAEIIFGNPELLQKVNQIIHPEVKKYILKIIETEHNRNQIDFLFVEAALLIEDHYDEILDELWYIHADVDIRIERLINTRGYTPERISATIQRQLDEDVYRNKTDFTVDNSGDFENTIKQIQIKLGGL